MAEHNKACCTTPAVVATGYTPKGSYEEVGGLNTYIVGTPTSPRGIIDIYDVFGLHLSTLQGADLLSAALGGALVLVPDFFRGAPLDPALFPPDTPEKKAAAQTFMAEKAGDFVGHSKTLLEVARAAGEKWPGVKGWGAFGLCWGGKVAALASGANTPFVVSGQAHPARLARTDAEAFTIPHICLGSPDEPAADLAAYAEVLASPGKTGLVETYKTMFHGWMGARAKLADEESRKEYERGYSQVAEYFGRFL